MMKLTDEQIIEGFRRGDEQVTIDYFYGYCRDAYRYLDSRYQLRYKEGLDFMTLAHTYYIHLMTHDWRPLEDRRTGVPLRSWMITGFSFVTRDALKAYATEHGRMSHPDDITQLEPTDHYSREEIAGIIEEICSTYYRHDRKAQEILRLCLLYGYKGKEVAAQWGMSPAAVSQRLKKMMDEVVRPYFLNYYVDHETVGAMPVEAMPMQSMGAVYADTCMDMSMNETFNENDMKQINPKRVTPEFITTLQPDEVFVFGSNLQGYHAGGAAHIACQRFGAVWGQGVGIQGQSYAIPTMQGPVETIRPYVEQFIAYAAQHPGHRFLVTRIGCGIAGFSPEDIAPLFVDAARLDNVALPADFWEVL